MWAGMPSVPADPTQLSSKPSRPCLPAEDNGIVASHSTETLTRLELPQAESEKHQNAATTSSLQGKSFQGLQMEKGAPWHKINCWIMILNTHTSTHSLGRDGREEKALLTEWVPDPLPGWGFLRLSILDKAPSMDRVTTAQARKGYRAPSCSFPETGCLALMPPLARVRGYS